MASLILGKTFARQACFLFQREQHPLACCFCIRGLKKSTKLKSQERISFSVPKPVFDFDYLCNEKNTDEIRRNILSRKATGDIDKLVSFWKKYHNSEEVEVSSFFQERSEDKQFFDQQIRILAAEIPNKTHPSVPVGSETQNELIATHGEKREYDFKPKSVVELGEDLGYLRTNELGHTTGHKTFYFTGDFAQLERALIRFSVDIILKHGFELMTVPELIHPSIIEGCGFPTSGARAQVYKLDNNKHDPACLTGTAEMPLVGYFLHKNLGTSHLPKKVAAVSRCFRAETSGLTEEQGVYRVHQFNKAEMLMLCSNEHEEQGNQCLQEILSIQQQIFSELDFPYRVLNMASEELGAPAYQKYDIEAWMPNKEFWGEISSCSNCTDYQSRRLDITYWSEKDDSLKFVNTFNGTACAAPRTLMAIVENNQNQDGTVNIPKVLQPYMAGRSKMEISPHKLNCKFIKPTRAYKKLLRLPEKQENNK